MTDNIERIAKDGIGAMIGAALGLLFAVSEDFSEGEILGTVLMFGLAGAGFAENMQLSSTSTSPTSIQSYNIQMN